MKIFNRHIYLAENGIPVGRGGASNAGGPATLTDAAVPGTTAGTGTAGPNQNARRGLFGTKKYIMITREKYRPPTPGSISGASSSHLSRGAHANEVTPGTAASGPDRAAAYQTQPSAPGFQKFTKLPVELQARIASMMPPEDRKRFRFAGEHTYQLGAMVSPHLKINSPALLKEALRKYSEGGIQSLTLSGPFENIYLNNRELQTLMRDTLNGLESFNISECRNLSDLGIMAATQHFPNLRQLNLSGRETRRELSALFLPQILAGLPNLRHLDLSNIIT